MNGHHRRLSWGGGNGIGNLRESFNSHKVKATMSTCTLIGTTLVSIRPVTL
jgi:hypothetical protein